MASTFRKISKYLHKVLPQRVITLGAHLACVVDFVVLADICLLLELMEI